MVSINLKAAIKRQVIAIRKPSQTPTINLRAIMPRRVIMRLKVKVTPKRKGIHDISQKAVINHRGIMQQTQHLITG